MIHIKEAIIVEGKYDKERLQKLTDAPILCTHGFHLYRSKAILESIRHLAKERGILILTDSDRAGFRIRNYLKSCLGKDCIIKNAYIPAIAGKERRKEIPGKEGLLGVEGMTEETLIQILEQLASQPETPIGAPVTKADLFADGLSGGTDSRNRRLCLTRHLHLPPKISTNALLDFINRSGGKPYYKKAIAACFSNTTEKDKDTV